MRGSSSGSTGKGFGNFRTKVTKNGRNCKAVFSADETCPPAENITIKLTDITKPVNITIDH